MTLVQSPTTGHHWEPDDHDLTPVPESGPIDGDRDAARVTTRIQRAAELRLMRLSWEQVAVRAGYSSRGAAFNAVMGYLRRQTNETISELREQESASYDRAAVALWPKVLAGDPRAQDTWLRNRAAYRVLHGLNAPVQVALSSGVQAALHDALAELDALVSGTVVSRTDELILPEPEPEPVDPAMGWDPDGV